MGSFTLSGRLVDLFLPLRKKSTLRFITGDMEIFLRVFFGEFFQFVFLMRTGAEPSQ